MSKSSLQKLSKAKHKLILSSRPHRSLDDEQLDSGDDEGRYDRREDRMDEAPDGETESLTIAEMTIARAPVPATNDPEVCDNAVLDATNIC